MQLCIGAKLNLDETKDLLAQAGYALSPCEKRDIIFSFFIEHEIFDMIEIDIALEEHGLPCFFSLCYTYLRNKKYISEVEFMRKCLTEIVFILDRSGSMSGLETDTISGYNSLLEKQKRGEEKYFL